MWNLFLASWLALAAVNVKVAPLAGESVTGTLTSLSSEQIVVATATGERTFDLINLASVSRADGTPADEAPADIRVMLLDGSILRTEAYTVTSGKATIKLVGGQQIETRTRSIRAVRLKPPLEAIEGAWQEIVDGSANGDVIVVRKASRPTEGDDKPAVVLDRLEGVVQQVTPDIVKFEFDGDTIDVRREKLEGIVYYSPVARELPALTCRLADASGSTWSVKTLKLDGDQLQIESTAGVVANLPLGALKKLDFSVGNTQFLSDLEPDAMEWSPFFDSPATINRLSKLYLPRRDTSFSGGRLMLGGQSFDKGLAIHSRTKLVYRIPKDSKKFLATVGIDDRVGDDGNVTLTISDDGKTLFEQSITGKDEPVEIALDLTGVRRLTILVDFGDEIDIGDHLNLCNARITK